MTLTDASGRTHSVWQVGEAAKVDAPDIPPLAGDASCDACVIGMGMAGLSVAHRLAAAGVDVLVIDPKPLAGGESIRTTGHLNSYIDDGLSDVANVHGEDKMKLAVKSHAAAIDHIEKTCRDEAIDAHFERSDAVLFVDPAGYGQDYLDKEKDACERAGLPAVRFEDRAPQIPGVDTGRSLVFGGQARFHAGRYYAGLANAIAKHGGRLRHARATGQIGDGRVETDRGTITCNWAITCTNTPVNPPLTDLVAIHTRQAPYRSYVVALRIPSGDAPTVEFSDTAEPYHYVRPARDGGGDVLIVGGEDHKTGHHTHQAGDADARFARLERWARERWPQCGEVIAKWSGQVMESHDYLAFIGQNPGGPDDKTLIATGDSGMGLPHGAIAGLVLADRVLGRDNPYADLYDPRREPASFESTRNVLREMTDVTVRYADHVTPGDVKSTDDLKPGQGAVIRHGAKKLAVYRDEAGQLHERSAVCPHMGCVVTWNSLEHTWDCPCHGGRYGCRDGHLINGPAVTGLSEA